MKRNENSSTRLNVTIIGSMFLMAPLVPRIAEGEVALVDILLRWAVAFGFVGIIVIMLSFALTDHSRTGMYARQHALEPAASEIEEAMLEFQKELNIDELTSPFGDTDDSVLTPDEIDALADEETDPRRRRASDV
jgi:hypothetical protein